MNLLLAIAGLVLASLVTGGIGLVLLDVDADAWESWSEWLDVIGGER